MTLEPLQLHLPADCYTMRIQPMKLVIGSNAFLSSIMGLLKLKYALYLCFAVWGIHTSFAYCHCQVFFIDSYEQCSLAGTMGIAVYVVL